MKVLVTGSTGFIGRHVINELLNYDCEIIATATSEEKAKRFDWYKKITFIPCDYHTSSTNFYEYFNEPDILIHLAWRGLPNYQDSFHVDENLPVNSRFLKNFIDHNISKLVVIGTCYEYGLQNGCLSEDCCTEPITQYGLAKDTLRRYLELYLNGKSTSFNWARLFFLYGEGQNPNSLLPQLERAIQEGAEEFCMSGGEQLRDYLLVEEVAQYICRMAFQTDVEGIVNCCSGEPISIRKLVEDYLVEHNADIPLNLGFYPYSENEPMAFWGNIDKLIQVKKE